MRFFSYCVTVILTVLALVSIPVSVHSGDSIKKGDDYHGGPRDWVGVNCGKGEFSVENLDGSGVTVFEQSCDLGNSALYWAEEKNKLSRIERNSIKKDKKGFEAAKKRWGYSQSAEELRLKYRQEMLYGLLDAQGNPVTKAEFIHIYPLSDTYAWAKLLDERVVRLNLKTMEVDDLPVLSETFLQGRTFNGGVAWYQVDPDWDGQSQLQYYFCLDNRKNSFDMAAVDGRGEVKFVLNNLRGNFNDRNKHPIALLTSRLGHVMFFGSDDNGAPITYHYDPRTEVLKAGPVVRHITLKNLYTHYYGNQKSKNLGYAFLEPAGRLSRDVGAGTLTYYNVIRISDLEALADPDPNYLGVIPVVLDRDFDTPVYRGYLFVYADGADYDFKLVNPTKLYEGFTDSEGNAKHNRNGKMYASFDNALEFLHNFPLIDDIRLEQYYGGGWYSAYKRKGGNWTSFHADHGALTEIDPPSEYDGPTYQAAFDGRIRKEQQIAAAWEEQQRIAAQRQAANDQFYRDRAQERYEREQLEEAQRRAADNAAYNRRQMWQSVSPFRENGMPKECYRNNGKLECY